MSNISAELIKYFLSLYNRNINTEQKDLEQYQTSILQVPIAPFSVQSSIVERKSIISVQGVSKRYKLGDQTVDALRDITLTIGRGEFVVVTGASGSGKSTLLQIMGCLSKPTSGRVIVESKEITSLGDNALSELRQNAIGFIFQSFYLQPFLRLNDNLAVPAMFTNEKKKVIDSKVEGLLHQVGLFEQANHFPNELSGGQIQRAAIARALVNNPRIILADEPTGNLDSVNSDVIIGLFSAIRDKLGTTIVVVTHDADIAHRADRVIELKDGVVI